MSDCCLPHTEADFTAPSTPVFEGLHSRAAWAPSRTAVAAIIAGVILCSLALRFRDLGAVYESSDQAAMPYLVSHSFGIRWIFAHDYGPVPALLHRTWIECAGRAGLPLDERAHRIPIALLGLAQVALTYPLMRRLRATPGQALLAVVCCAALPTLVMDARYSWGYLTVWLLAGTAALWATLAYVQDRRPWMLAVAAAALFAHCLSNCYSFALPIALAAVWVRELATRTQPSYGCSLRSSRWKTLAPPLLGYALPCVLAVLVLIISWRWTGAGAIGHLLHKRELQSEHHAFLGKQLLALPAFWASQYGYLMAAISGLGLLLATRRLLRPDAGGVTAVWAWACLLPIVLCCDWSQIGYPGAYVIEAIYCGGLLAAMVISEIHRRLRGFGRIAWAALASLALIQMAAGSADDSLHQDQYRIFHGVSTGGWGAVRPDTGLKAAGCYVRQHVPLDATVLCLHTRYGMELPVAEYYCGRKVLAHYDLREDMLAELLQRMRGHFDVVIAEAAHSPLLAASGLQCVATLRRDGQPVRRIYARPELSFPTVDTDITALNGVYDRSFRPRRLPVPLPAAANFLSRLKCYQETIRAMRGTSLEP